MLIVSTSACHGADVVRPPLPAPASRVPAPPEPKWPSNLPQAFDLVEPGTLHVEGWDPRRLEKGTVIVPPQMAIAAEQWDAEALDAIEQCPGRIDSQAVQDERALKAHANALWAACDLRVASELEEAGSVTWWHLALGVSGGVAFGLVVGAIAAWGAVQ